jgi:ABC-type transport system involved in cytochrome bd biosynthesis fused ATPase/permease subunit
MTYAWLHNPKLRPADLILTKRLSTLICNPLVFRTVGIYHHESCVIMIITRPLAKLFGGLVLIRGNLYNCGI